jgi:hypothetical protein
MGGSRPAPTPILVYKQGQSMLRHIIKIITLMLLLMALLLVPISAQNAPDAINAAYADLSQRVGVTLNTTNTNWRWEQAVYDDSSLGCPAAVAEPVVGQVVAYRFTLTYNSITYDYRVSADQTIVVLCEEFPEGQPPANSPDAEEAYSNPRCVPADGTAPATDVNYLRNRVVPDNQAQPVEQFGLNNLRDMPDINGNLLAQIPASAVYTISAGPECDAEGNVWWQVDYDGVVGWVAESYQGDYLVQPFAPRALPSRMAISPENSQQVVEVARIQGNLYDALAFSPDSTRLTVVGDVGAEGLWLYDLANLVAPPRLVEIDLNIVALDYFNDGVRVLVGTREGDAHILDTQPDSALIERLYLNSFQQFAQFVTISPDETRFAISGQNALTNADVPRENVVMVWEIANVSQSAILYGATGIISDGAYSPDGTRLAGIDSSGALHSFDPNNTSAPLQTMTGQNSALAYSPNGQFLAVGDLAGVITLYNPLDMSAISQLTGSLGFISDVTFSPDNRLLASVGTDGVLRLWNTQSDAQLAAIETGIPTPRMVRFSPDGTLIAVTGDDDTVRLYAVPTA